MYTIIKNILCLFITLGTCLSCYAAAYQLIPSGKRVDKTASGQVYSYQVFYVDNINQRISICSASFIENKSELTLECGAIVSLDWKLPKSSRVNSTIVGKFDISEDNLDVPFGIWQIDELTGDLQFCISGNLAKKNCVFSHIP